MQNDPHRSGQRSEEPGQDPAVQPDKVPELLPLALMDRLDVALCLVPLDRESPTPVWTNRPARELLGDPPYPAAPSLIDEETRQRLRAEVRSGSLEDVPVVSHRTRTGPGGGIGDIKVQATPVETITGNHALITLEPAATAPTNLPGEADFRYEALVKQAPDPIVIHQGGKLLFANEAAAGLFGFDHPEELVGEQALDFVHPDDRELARRRMKRLADGHEVGRVEETLVDADGEIVHAEVTAKRVLYDAEPATQLMLRDVTERKLAEKLRDRRMEELQQTQRDLEALADALSHDVRSPLDSATRHLQRIERDADDDQVRADAEQAVQEVDRMRAMLDSLLEYSRLSAEKPDFDTVELDRVVESVLEDLDAEIEASNARVQVEQLGPVQGDEDLLCRVFENLLSNVIQYAGDEPPEITIRTVPDSDDTLVEIEDAGQGMDPEEVERALERSPRLEADIPGQDLAICRRTVDKHGGEIAIDTQPVEGTLVRLRLPSPSIDAP